MIIFQIIWKKHWSSHLIIIIGVNHNKQRILCLCLSFIFWSLSSRFRFVIIFFFFLTDRTFIKEPVGLVRSCFTQRIQYKTFLSTTCKSSECEIKSLFPLINVYLHNNYYGKNSKLNLIHLRTTYIVIYLSNQNVIN